MEKNSQLNNILNFNIDSLFPYMPDLSSFFQSIDSLQGNWSVLKVLAASNGMNINISEVQDNFIGLSDSLKKELIIAKASSLLQDQSAKAQSLVDILIRNLFERTADIGFFAMDDDLRKHLTSEFKTSSVRRKAVSSIRKRFYEYQKKYSVYKNIQLFGVGGKGIKMLLQLDETCVMADKTFPNDEEWLNMVARSNKDYIEAFGPSKLDPNSNNSLIYAHSIRETNEPESPVVGVLVLHFSFEDEMDRIFKKLLGTRTLSIACLLDKNGKVISSSNEGLISCGIILNDEEINANGLSLVHINGEEYLLVTRETNGYEGYFGQGWKSAIFISTRFAFKKEPRQINDNVINAIVGNETLFSSTLRSIPEQSQKILSALKLLVLNGQLQRSEINDDILNTLKGSNKVPTNQKLFDDLANILNSMNDNSQGIKSVLDAVEKVGKNTEEIFHHSIGRLQSVILTTVLHAITFMAQSAVDIMDRNLYERANDVRWWALSKIRLILTENSDLTNENRLEIVEILASINELYTVYTSLIVYDLNGNIIAASKYDKERDIGVALPFDEQIYNQRLTQEWAKKALLNTDSQKYTVSEMESSPLYDNQHTYIYASSITNTKNSEEVLGGIAVVFDSTPQFEAMLKDVIPKDENDEIIDGYKAIYVDRNGKILASSDEMFVVGDTFHLEQKDRDKFFSLNNGLGISDVIRLNGEYYAAAVGVSDGYREYKSTDGYQNDILSFVLAHLGKIPEEKVEIDVFENDYVKNLMPQASNSGYKDLLIVSSQKQVYSIAIGAIKEIVNMHGFTKMSGASEKYHIGQLPYDGATIPVIDLLCLHSDEPSEHKSNITHNVIVCYYNNSLLGLMVSDLNRIYRVSNEYLSGSILNGGSHYSTMIAPPRGKDIKGAMIPVLDTDAVLTYLREKQIRR